jgi:hypothetical protein
MEVLYDTINRHTIGNMCRQALNGFVECSPAASTNAAVNWQDYGNVPLAAHCKTTPITSLRERGAFHNFILQCNGPPLMPRDLPRSDRTPLARMLPRVMGSIGS